MGADPMLGFGLRVLSPGVTIRAHAFQAIHQPYLRPASGQDMAHVLGNYALTPSAEVQARPRSCRPSTSAASARTNGSASVS